MMNVAWATDAYEDKSEHEDVRVGILESRGGRWPYCFRKCASADNSRRAVPDWVARNNPIRFEGATLINLLIIICFQAPARMF